MAMAVAVALIILALLGHGLLWVGLINRLHASGLSRRRCDLATALGVLGGGLVPLLFLGPLSGPVAVLGGSRAFTVSWPGAAYVCLCWAAGLVAIQGWTRHHLLARPPAVLRSLQSRLHRVGRPPAGEGHDDRGHDHHFLAHLPGNEMLQLDVVQRALEIQRLAAPLEGLRIAHLSDLHFSGRIGKAYFQEVVRLANELSPDLVAITGDLIDKEECIDWIPDTVGRLQSRYGAFFVLGNHDLWIDYQRLRQTLANCGLTDVGGRWLQVSVRGEPVVVAGNELPWFSPPANLAAAPPRSADGRPLRLALCHSPDQFRWSQAHDVDLMLAGHTHGGQIRFPVIGAVVAPSWWGVRHACGTFHAPPTVMHVSRGISAKTPLRMNCPPELGCLVLHAPRAGKDEG
jgi:predicted MPP superfamily phosphohydrolase